MSKNLELVFDGDCGLCLACVRWVLRRDNDGLITSGASQMCSWSDASELPFLDTVVVRSDDGTTFLRSSAVAKTLSALPGFWGIFGKSVLFVNLFAPFRKINDFLYDFVAKNRQTLSNGLVRCGLLDSSCRSAPSQKS